jgi:preprotein translocase SecE subunit
VKPKKFFSEALAELKQITWPTRKETLNMVYVIVGLSLVVAAFLGLWDKIFLEMIRFFARI